MGLLMGFGGNAFDPEAMAAEGGLPPGFFLNAAIVFAITIFTSLWIAVAGLTVPVSINGNVRKA